MDSREVLDFQHFYVNNDSIEDLGQKTKVSLLKGCFPWIRPWYRLRIWLTYYVGNAY